MALDPKTNRQERKAEKAKKQQAPPLNPPFPHKLIAYMEGDHVRMIVVTEKVLERLNRRPLA